MNLITKAIIGAVVLGGGGYYLATRKKTQPEPELPTEPALPPSTGGGGGGSVPPPTGRPGANVKIRVKDMDATRNYGGAKIRGENPNNSAEAYKAAIGEILGTTTGKTTTISGITFLEFIRDVDGKKYNVSGDFVETASATGTGTNQLTSAQIAQNILAAINETPDNWNKVVLNLQLIPDRAAYFATSDKFKQISGSNISLLSFLFNELNATFTTAATHQAFKPKLEAEFIRMGLVKSANGTWS